MYPIDALTDIDKSTIQSFLSIYGDVECGPLYLVLKEWNKNKKTLFKALGNRLSVSKMITIPKSETLVTSELESVFHPFLIWYESDKNSAYRHPERLREITNSDFVTDVILYWIEQGYCLDDLRTLTQLFRHNNFIKGYITCIRNTSDNCYHFRDFKCTVKKDMKTIRTIQKVLKATKYPRMELFEAWRNQVSLVQISNEIQAKLVISINPIDFLSMSENACNWRSCMGWSNSGCYNAGTLEMMNSNVAAVAYLEANSPFELHLNETGEVYNVPNKTWRSLVFIHKDILLLGKQYPYHNDNLSPIVLDFVRGLLKENLNWKYQFINQEYRDMDKIDGNFYLRDYFNLYYDKKRDHHSIFLYTNGMYNDIIEAHSPHYLCCRNYVPKSKKICLSGPATCICCGDRLFYNSRDEIFGYDDLGNDKVCWNCKQNKCAICGKIHYHSKYKTRFGHFCSDECVNDAVILPDFCNAICTKEDLAYIKGSHIVIFDEDGMFEIPDIWAIQKEFIELTKDEIPRWIHESELLKGKKVYRVPAAIASWKYANIPTSTGVRKNADETYYLSFVDQCCSVYLRNNIKRTEKRLLLTEYLKGGA